MSAETPNHNGPDIYGRAALCFRLPRALLDSLPAFESIDDRNRDSTIEILRQIAEVLVWGEQHNGGYFDIFCEQNVLSYFIRLAEQPAVPNAVKVQLLQTLSIIVQSINKETAVCKSARPNNSFPVVTA